MADRDEHIQDKERKVYDLKKRNQELEKYKFVLDYRIKELKEQVEPRENYIAEMNRQIQDINEELKTLSLQKGRFEEKIVTYQTMLDDTKEKAIKEHRKVKVITRYAKDFKIDLEDVIRYFQDTSTLKKVVQNLYRKYSKKNVGVDSDFDSNVKREFLQHQENLKNTITDLRNATETQLTKFRTQTVQTMSENQELIR